MDVLTATSFHRHNRPLRAVMIDNQPWFVATDYARMLGLHHPTVLARRLEDGEVRPVRLLANSGSEEVIPLLRDQHQENPHQPRRMRMTWLAGDVTVLDWQGDIWVPLDEMPTFSRVTDKPSGPRGFWKR